MPAATLPALHRRYADMSSPEDRSEDRPEDRLIELETRLTWQEDALSVLSAEIQRQQRLIDLLEQRLKALGDRLTASDQPVFQGTARDEIPPHW